MSRAKVPVKVDGRELTLSNLDKVLYPEVGFAKAEVIDYYSRIAPVLLPHLDGRPLTVKRYPNGVEGASFFEKNAPEHTPEWVRRVRLPVPGSTKNRETIDFAIVEDLPTLVYYANLAALELHVPQWRVSAEGEALPPDTLVFDLDPGPPATIVECCEVALMLRAVLADDGLTARPKTSGSKGMQLYADWDGRDEASAYARRLAQMLAKEHPEQVLSVMTRKLRPGKVFIDWSQNNPAKTTVAPYSLRARAHPTVSTPLLWKEVEACENPEDLVFTTSDVLARVDEHGDLFTRA
ncbi:non-homologous end-joining DNA ligase [Nonomuraea sp. NPDC049714]|uniref:non-homologous end-joining DNA ligase n=1 Tax=Nonomuraea sp. NPDC049714 TaxID=3364357 RepID=UPI0037A78839